MWGVKGKTENIREYLKILSVCGKIKGEWPRSQRGAAGRSLRTTSGPHCFWGRPRLGAGTQAPKKKGGTDCCDGWGGKTPRQNGALWPGRRKNTPIPRTWTPVGPANCPNIPPYGFSPTWLNLRDRHLSLVGNKQLHGDHLLLAWGEPLCM